MKQMASTPRQRRKATGSHYTPGPLADYLAGLLVARLEHEGTDPLRILDPACGDGALLDAILHRLANAVAFRHISCEIVGIDEDNEARDSAQARLASHRHVRMRLLAGNYLELSAGPGAPRSLWDAEVPGSELVESIDVVIANPPYVRTQVLGSRRSRELASQYGLRGRVDLYHAFLVAMTASLRPGGLLGIITSNRFLTTLSGASVREYLASHYEIEEIVDLGDSKLFDAAVLPSILVGRKRHVRANRSGGQIAPFTRLYSAARSIHPAPGEIGVVGSVVDILSQSRSGWYRAENQVFELTRGQLELHRNSAEVWKLNTDAEAEWLSQLHKATRGSFEDVASVRVGIKTTADEVFIRSDWEDLPEGLRPEPPLLKPILSHEHARQWRLPAPFDSRKRILYPHEIREGRRGAVDLRRYPRTKGYLESHRSRLERRHYVIEAGRQWYEIWVPQDPSAWSLPKIVFPDISPGPRFYLDRAGYLIDGDCYWMTLHPGVPNDVIYLLLGIANSSLCERFHELAFNNRLYSARRRYITQYVKKYPLPDMNSTASQDLIETVKQMCHDAHEAEVTGDHPLKPDADRLVWAAFGMKSERGAVR